MTVSGRFAANRVLLVDASQETRERMQAALTRAGCEALVAADGFEALSLIAEREPDVVIANADLPRLNGYQLCALVKRHSRHSGTPVVVVCSSETVVERARARNAGSDALLVKPLAPERLLDMLTLSESATEAKAPF